MTGPTSSTVPKDWPDPPAPAVFRGLIGDIVRAVETSTEADPITLLVTGLTLFGALAEGPRIHQGSWHHANIYSAIIGETSKARKGTGYTAAKAAFDLAVPDWASVIVPGIGSGEGLVSYLYEHELDPRALIKETEFAGLLTRMGRDGSTLSMVLRDAWDHEPLGRYLAETKGDRTVRRHHVSLLAHATVAELQERFRAIDMANGFGNCCLFFAVRRQRLLPFAPDPSALVQPFLAALHEACEAGRIDRVVEFSEAARPVWERIYLADAAKARLGLTGAVCARAEAQIVRLALAYSALDLADAISAEHLEAAAALWGYAERSARYLFGDSVGDPYADLVRSIIREGPTTVSKLRNEHGLKDPVRLAKAVDILVTLGLATVEPTKSPPTGGRPSRCIRSTEPRP